MSFTATKTIHGAYINLVRDTPNDFVAPSFSTLNQKFNIQSGVNPDDGTHPEPNYFIVGRGGHRNVAGAGNASLVDIHQHDVTDACLFEAMPFVMRETDNDLGPTDRSKYRLRRLERHNNVDYFVYYLKLLNANNVVPVIETVVVENGTATTSSYTPIASQLEPTPIILDPNEATNSSGRHKVISTPVSCDLSALDAQEIVDACSIIYGDVRYAVISELGIVAAIDKEITTNEGGVDVTYNEAIVATCTDFIGADVNLNATSDGAEFKFRLTSSLPHLI